jgi:TrpR-related protein YerC/YecD
VLYLTKVDKPNWDNQKTEDLVTAMLLLKNPVEMRNFFRDLLTEQEIVELGNRWKAANMLNENVPYTKIEQETGLSSTTVARISKWLKNGTGGYKLVIKRANSGRKHHNHSLSHHGKGSCRPVLEQLK